MARLNRFAAASALAAAFSLSATPAMAHGYYHHHRWHRDRVDGGDVLAGALIIGGIAAIASAANMQDRQDREPASPPPPLPADRQGYGNDQAEPDTGLDRAADLCADAVERGPNRVESVDDVRRDRDGWAVAGVLQNGAGFTCRVGNDGQVQDVDIAGSRGDEPQAREDDDNNTPPEADDRPEWHGDDAQPQPEPQDDGRYSTSDAPDFGDRT